MFMAGYVLGLMTAGFYLVGEALYESMKVKKRKPPSDDEAA